MTESYLFLGMIAIAGFLTYFARYTAQILVRMAASLSWLALGVWLLLGDVALLDISQNWAKILGFVFVIMVIVPLTWQMRTDVQKQASIMNRSKGYTETSSWTEWDVKPKKKEETSEDRQRAYREQVREAVERARRRRLRL